MDGSSISLAVNGFTDLDYFILDRRHARIYWEYSDKYGVYVLDMLEGQKSITVPTFSARDFWPGKILLHASGDIFIWFVKSRGKPEVIRTDITDGARNFSVLYTRRPDENYVEVLPQEAKERRSNPCPTKNCSHICVLSGPQEAGCLCGRGQGLSLNRVTCMGTKR